MESRNGNRLLYALTGRPGCGKTTAVLRIVEGLMDRNIRVDGMYTVELRVGGRRVGFKVRRIGGGEGTLAHVNLRTSHRIGRYYVNLRDLEEVGVKAILEGVREADFIVVDEVGPMELLSKGFRDAVKTLLDSGKHCLLTVHYRSRDPLVEEVKRAAGRRLIVLDESNRDRVPSIVVGEVVRELG